MKYLSGLIAATLVFLAGCSGFPNIELNRSYHYDSLRTIGLYLHPSDNVVYDRELLNLVRLKFSALGYEIKNLSPVWNRSSLDTAVFLGHKETAAHLFADHGINCDIIVVIKPSWNIVLREISSHRDEGSILTLDKLSLEFTAFAKDSLTPLISKKIDRLEDVFDDKKKRRLVGVSERVLMQKVLNNILTDFPVCTKTDDSPARYTFPIALFVDSAYISYYSTTWKFRLAQRMLFVNDVYKRYFDTQFNVVGYFGWKPSNDTNVEESLNDLIKKTKDVQDIFIAGIMVNEKLIHRWREGSEAGIASFYGKRFVSCDLIYLPGMENWNALEESAVIIHELGHVFGGCHTLDVSSAMYPSINIMSFEFDSLNMKLIKYARNNIDRVPRKQLLENNVTFLLGAYTNNMSRKTKYVPQSARNT